MVDEGGGERRVVVDEKSCLLVKENAEGEETGTTRLSNVRDSLMMTLVAVAVAVGKQCGLTSLSSFFLRADQDKDVPIIKHGSLQG